MRRKQKHPTRTFGNDPILVCDNGHDHNINVNHLPNHNPNDSLSLKPLSKKRSRPTRRTKRSNTSRDEESSNNNQTAVIDRDERVFFIKRELNKSDMDNQQHRLSMPCNQVRGHEFFTSGETARLKAGSFVAAKLIDPRGEEYEINLNIRKAGPSTCSYALGKPWNRVKKENGFRAGMVLDVWARRGEVGEPCFVLEKSS